MTVTGVNVAPLLGVRIPSRHKSKTRMNTLSKEIHAANVKKGFYEEEKNIGEMLALIHSEVSEMLEAHREGRSASGFSSKAKLFKLDDEDFKTHFLIEIKDTIEDELADTVIRCLDLAGYLDIDIEAHVKAKLRYNSLRPYKHGKKY